MEPLTVLSISRRQHINHLELSDGTQLKLPHALFLKCRWRTGSPISLQEFEVFLAENEYSAAMERAGYALSGRSRSAHELRTILTGAGYSENCAERVVLRLEEVGYLDDDAFASNWIQKRSNAGFGSSRIRMELRQKGIDPELIDKALASQKPDSQSDGAQAAAKKAAHGKNLNNPKDRQKVIAALARRGFDFETAKAAVAAISQPDEEDW